MKGAPAVVTLGECMAVLYPAQPIGLDRAAKVLLDIAGTEANTAIGLSRLGVRTRFISRVGDDPFGRRIRATLDREGVDIGFLETDSSAPTGIFFREPLADGARRVYYYRSGSAASRMTPEGLNPEAFRGARIVHLSGITPALSVTAAATVRRAIEIARQVNARVSFDPNYRAPLWDRGTAAAILTDLVRQVDIVLMSEEDATVLFGGGDTFALARAAELGPATVVVKQAERGAIALCADKLYHSAPRRVKQVVDTVGAGDGFNAGFLAATLRGLDIQECLDLGAEIGAKAVGRLGDYAGYPRKREKRKGAALSGAKGKREK
ncbi:MAG: sugar kinase [Gemmatimonadetes bacterium]|nr:sugar kinase [Gemmatimonadota bacterium]